MIETTHKTSGEVQVEWGGQLYEVDYVATVGDFTEVECEQPYDLADEIWEAGEFAELAEATARADAERQVAQDECEPTGALSGRTLEVVLAALRYMQEDMNPNSDLGPPNVAGILESGPTTPDEIDRIAEALNMDAPYKTGWTVILHYPDYIGDGYEDDTYVEWSDYSDEVEAIADVRRKAVAAQDNDNRQLIDDPTDFALVGTFAGHHQMSNIEY